MKGDLLEFRSLFTFLLLLAGKCIAANDVIKDEYTERTVPEDCSLVLAESTIPNAGWGVFSLTSHKRGDLLSEHGDIVIHLTDPNPTTAVGMKRLIWEYLWDGQEVGGQYEGQKVMSLAAGIGTLANGEASMFNVLPMQPSVDNSELNRSAPSSGSFTHYHNLTWVVEKNIKAGSEIFVNYGEGWFRERGYHLPAKPSGLRSKDWLWKHGYCLDNIAQGTSTIENAGRGGFARRTFKKDDILGPVPVIPLSRDSLQTIKQHESGRVVILDQLLRNYCFGHSNSSLLLYPYFGMINLINHAPSGRKANADLRWSKPSAAAIFSSPLIGKSQQPQVPQLLLELVATSPIEKGDEILLDYGKAWVQAWQLHSKRWPSSDTPAYVAASTANVEIDNQVLRTISEQQKNPYPDNVFTSCYYKHDVYHQGKVEEGIHAWGTTADWAYHSRDLRPCVVLDRHRASSTGDEIVFFYTVQILNRPGLAPSARIPRGKPHVVTGVPRSAIMFSDKLYTTDQHLETAFRHEIGLPIFPLHWMDLNKTEHYNFS